MKLSAWVTELKDIDARITYCPLSDHHNELPDAHVTPMHPLEASHALHVYMPQFVQRKQLINQAYYPHPSWLPSDYTQVTIYFLHNYAIVEASNGKWHIERPSGHIIYETPLYFKYGCSHPNLTHTTPYNCYHVYKCPDCNTEWSVDSSG